MTEINPCNCSDCSKRECWIHPIHYDEVVTRGNPCIPSEEYLAIQKHTKQRGCLSNPKVRQVVMDNVITDLEQKFDRLYDSSPNNLDDNGRMYNQDELNMLEEIIKEIKKSG